jgi:hypothetical protein
LSDRRSVEQRQHDQDHEYVTIASAPGTMHLTIIVTNMLMTIGHAGIVTSNVGRSFSSARMARNLHPGQVWSWDITKLKGPGKWTCFHLYVILDIFSRYVVLGVRGMPLECSRKRRARLCHSQ